MGKKRIIDMDGLCFDAEITEIGMDACMLYIRMWTLAEDWGGIDLEPKNLRLQMGGLQDNYTSLRITEIIEKLVQLDKVKIYEVQGRMYGWIKNFPRHQELRFPSPPKIPLPSWVRWHPKTDKTSPVQHYEYLSIDISVDSTIDSSVEHTVEQSTDCANVNEEKRSRREINIKKSFLDTPVPSTSVDANGKHLSESERKLLQLGGGSLLKPLKGDRMGQEPSYTQEQRLKQNLERIKILNEKKGIKPE